MIPGRLPDSRPAHPRFKIGKGTIIMGLLKPEDKKRARWLHICKKEYIKDKRQHDTEQKENINETN